MNSLILSSKEKEISDTARRILEISSSYATDREFLKKCDISNFSFLTDVRKGRANAPGADKLEKIVRGTGCSGTWLLTGEGEKYALKKDSPQQGMIAQALRLISKYDLQLSDLQGLRLPRDAAMQSSKLTKLLLEKQIVDNTAPDE